MNMKLFLICLMFSLVFEQIGAMMDCTERCDICKKKAYTYAERHCLKDETGYLYIMNDGDRAMKIQRKANEIFKVCTH